MSIKNKIEKIRIDQSNSFIKKKIIFKKKKNKYFIFNDNIFFKIQNSFKLH
jgi:hypothetical protein